MNRIRAISLSSAIILLCTLIIVGVTFALFSESVTLSNHLQAGELTLKLTRTDLKYAVLNEKGYIELVENGEYVDFSNTNSSDANIFDLRPDAKTYIAPGSYFEATMELENVGDVAFTYEVVIKMGARSNNVNQNLAEQLLLTVVDSSGNVVNEKLLKDFYTDDGVYTLISDLMEKGDDPDTFTIKVKFLDTADEEDQKHLGEFVDNNDAQAEIALFDLYVIAVQKTTAPEQSTPEQSTPEQSAPEQSATESNADGETEGESSNEE